MKRLSSSKVSLVYVSFERTDPHSAAGRHVSGILKNLDSTWVRRLLSPSGRHKLLAWAGVYIRFLRCRNVDVVYLRLHPLSLGVILLARARNSVVVAEVNGPASDLEDAYPQFRFVTPVWRCLFWYSIRLAHLAVVMTPEMQRHVSRKAPGTVTALVPVGIDSQVTSAEGAQSAPEVPSDTSYVCYIGSLTHWQGIETLLEAATSTTWPADVSLLICGDGPLRPKVEQYAMLHQRIRYLGTVSAQVGASVLRHASASVCPKEYQINLPQSERTGLFPLKVVESLAQGTPVVATDLPGLRKLVSSEAGILVRPADPVDLARGVTKVMLGAYDRERIAARARTEHSWEQRASDTMRAIREFLPSSPSPAN